MPSAASPYTVSVTLKSQVIEAAEDAKVVHMDDDGNTSVVDQTENPAADEVSFEAESFSIYAIVDGGEQVEFRRTYKFLNEVQDGSASAYLFYNKASGHKGCHQWS